MRLLLTTDTIGGVWTYTVELARALEPHGVQISLATMGDPLSSDQRRQVASLPHVSIFESRYKLEWMPQPWDDVRDAGQWLLELEAEIKPDVVHLNGFAHGSLSWRSPVLVVAHSCVLSWWQAVKGEPAPADWNQYRRAVRDGLRSADAWVAPSSAMLAAVQRHYGPLSNGRVIYNGRDAREFRSRHKEPYILSAGRLWDEAKNVATLCVIAPALDWPVYIAGEGGLQPTPNVNAMGRIDPLTLADWMSRAEIYALPARYEPFGLSILEAALSGCALILGDIRSLRELWSDAAVFVDPDDAQALQRALTDLIRNPAGRRDMAAHAAARAKRYSTERMVRAYLDLYHELRAAPAAISAAAPLAERITACG